MFTISYKGGDVEQYLNVEDIAQCVTEINRRKEDIIQFTCGNIKLFPKDGAIVVNGLAFPFAFHSSTTEFVLFNRARAVSGGIDLSKAVDGKINVEFGQAKLHFMGFGLRNTVMVNDGVNPPRPRNHIQLFWVAANGSIMIGGNK